MPLKWNFGSFYSNKVDQAVCQQGHVNALYLCIVKLEGMADEGQKLEFLGMMRVVSTGVREELRKRRTSEASLGLCN